MNDKKLQLMLLVIEYTQKQTDLLFKLHQCSGDFPAYVKSASTTQLEVVEAIHRLYTDKNLPDCSQAIAKIAEGITKISATPEQKTKWIDMILNQQNRFLSE